MARQSVNTVPTTPASRASLADTVAVVVCQYITVCSRSHNVDGPTQLALTHILCIPLLWARSASFACLLFKLHSSTA